MQKTAKIRQCTLFRGKQKRGYTARKVPYNPDWFFNTPD
nr:MAG TPA_asm: hypothetical protein [Caudoviricetes sp.]